MKNLLRDLSVVHWGFIDSLIHVNSKVKFLSDSLRTVYDSHAPLREFICRKPHSPWITTDIKKLSQSAIMSGVRAGVEAG